VFKKLAILASSLGSTLALAAADANITAGIADAQSAFTDNWGAVFSFYIGVVVVLTAGAMLVKYIRRAK